MSWQCAKATPNSFFLGRCVFIDRSSIHRRSYVRSERSVKSAIYIEVQSGFWKQALLALHLFADNSFPPSEGFDDISY